MTHVRDAVAGVMVLLLVGPMLAGCGGDDDGGTASPRSATTTAGTATAEAVTVGERYLTALVAPGGPALDDMLALAAPDSVAERYAAHTSALAEVQVASGEPPEGGTATVDGDTVLLTLTGSSGQAVTTTWGDFALDEDGRLERFTINGVDLDDRIVVGGDSDTTAGVTATLVSAFELVSNDSPVVIVEIENGSPRQYHLRRALYESTPDGAAQTSEPGGAGLVVGPGATRRAALIFGTAPFGGTLTLVGDLGGARGVPVRQTLPLSG